MLLRAVDYPTRATDGIAQGDCGVFGDIHVNSAAELAELITTVNKIDRSLETLAITHLHIAA